MLTTHLLLAGEGSCYVFSTRNNCCEFLASDGFILQSDHQRKLSHMGTVKDAGEVEEQEASASY